MQNRCDGGRKGFPLRFIEGTRGHSRGERRRPSRLPIRQMNLAFYLLAVVPFLAALTVQFLGIETKGKVLEQLEA